MALVVQTARLALRHLEARDAPFILALVNDPAWLRFIGDRGVRDVEAARRYIEDKIIAMYERHGFGLWMVEDREDGRPMGICGLVKRDTLPEVDLGFAFMPEFRGRGLAYEAATASRDYAVGELGIGRLLAITSPLNLDSIRLLERLGFVRERDMPWAGDEKDVVAVYAYAPQGSSS